MTTTFKKSLLASATCLQSLSLIGGAAMLLTAVPAFAQDVVDPQAEDAAAEESTIIVTGSLIRNPNLELSSPVNVTTADTLELKQTNTAEEALRDLPGFVANVGNSTNNGNGGSSFVDLRGLGTQRNIVLLDGNRLTPADLSGRVDLNNIPLALISRVDALTGAAVTTYGADAITGVVNFVTKKDFAGIDLSANQQITEQGDGNYFRADLTIGANFDDGRGNAVLSVGYQDSDPIYQGARDFSEFQIDSFSGTFGGSGTSVPSRFSGTRPIDPATGQPSVNPATANGGVRQINAAGQAVGTFAFFNFAPFNLLQVPFERFNIFAQANYEASDAVEVYTRGLFSKNTVSTIVAPSGSFGGTVTINLNNPFLPAPLRNQFCAFNTAAVGSGLYTPRFTPAECAAAALATGPTDPRYRTVTPTLGRRAVETGPRIDEYTTTIFDYRVGARGGVTDSIDWDVSAAYGQSEVNQRRINYTLQSRFRQASLASGTAANPVCEVASGGCVPANIFGPAGSISPASAAFLAANISVLRRTTLAQVRGIVSGDLGFTSPGASEPVGFALGTEYRKYGAEQISDVLASQAGEVGGAGGAQPSYDGGYDVYEGYAELIAPLIEDKPFFHSLTLEAGARYSHYSVDGGPTNNTTTYKIGGSWEPVDSLKFRGSYAHAVRAPNIFELFNPLTTVLTNLAVDPCAGAGPLTNANLRAVCIAQGAPAGSIGSITNPTAAQANITSGGGINLSPEKADTYTFGAVFQPSFLPRFTMSVDYYNIKVTDVIGAPLPGDLVNACFGSATTPVVTAASATDINCTVIRRNPITGGLDGDPATTFGLFAPLSNQGKLFTDGIDLLANYNRDFGSIGWAMSFVGNYTLNSKFKATPAGINRECVGFYSVNCSFTGSLQPKFQWSLRNTFTIDEIDLSLLWRHIDGFVQEPQDVLDSGPAFVGNLPTTGANDFLHGREVDFGQIPSYDFFDLSLRFNVSENFTFTALVQNVFDKQPPNVGASVGSTAFNTGNTYPSTYDAVGRRFGVGAKIRF